ncbi:MAG: hydroxyacid dehydrogenase [Erysipelotrichaceae bacterium]|nr:hydroxyacid dehydrogenase [Erysipelotrichaceae bacterium]
MNEIVYLVNGSRTLVRKLLEEAGFNVIAKPLPFDDELLSKAYALLPGNAPITAELLDKAPELKIIVKTGVGMDRVDIDACTERNIIAANTPLANYIAVAEHTVALILAAAKRLYPVSMKLHNDHPDWKAAREYASIELCGKTISIIGYGNIGKRVAKLLSGFDMRIIAYSPHLDIANLPEYVEGTLDMDYALSQADFVSIHASGDKARNLIDERELSLMKPSAILINTTRGHVINEKALINALKSNVIAGAALDVFTHEPIEDDNPLLIMDNVIATPHTAAHTPEAERKMETDIVETVINYRNTGIIPESARNKKALEEKNAN